MAEASAKYQYFAAIVVNMLSIGYGVTCGWTSPNFLILMSDETPLASGKITMDEASWIAAFMCLGGMIGNIFFGFITNNYGRKEPLLVLAIPTILSWLLILFAQNVYYIYGGRFLNGLCGGAIFVILPLYLNEIANDRVRGTLGSTIVLNCNFGILLAFVLGDYCDFYTTPKFVIVLTCVFTILFYFFPESPSFLMKQCRDAEAEKSIKFYQNMSDQGKDYELVQQEMSKLKNAFGSMITAKHEAEPSLRWSDLTSKTSRKAMLIGVVLAALNQFCGCFAMLNYTASIFKESGSNISPNTSAIIVAVIQLIGSYVATVLVDRAGRRFLFAVSSIGTALGLIVLATYMYLKSQEFDVSSFTWVPITSFSFVIFIASWALLSLPFLVISEVMPERLKSFGVSFCMEVVWFFAFILLKYLPLITDLLGMHGSMFFFASCCLLGATFILTSIPETKGRSYEEIMKSLSN